MTRLLAAIVAMALVFGTFVYLLVVTAALGPLIETFVAFDAIGSEEQAQLEQIDMIATRIVPAFLALGALLFGYVAVSRRQGRTGRI